MGDPMGEPMGEPLEMKTEMQTIRMVEKNKNAPAKCRAISASNGWLVNIDGHFQLELKHFAMNLHAINRQPGEIFKEVIVDLNCQSDRENATQPNVQCKAKVERKGKQKNSRGKKLGCNRFVF